MNIDSQILEPILLKEGYVSEEEMKKAKEAISKSKDSLLDYFLNAKILNKELVGQALAESFNVSYVNVHSSPSTSEYVQKIPEEIAKKYHAVLFSEEKAQVSVATDDPKNPELIKELKKIFVGKKIVLAFSFFENISPSFAQYQKPLETRFSEIIAEKGHIAPEILEEIFNDAFVFHASDIHFEPQRKEVLVRFRVDGVLHEAGRIPKEFYENILNRLKVQSGMRIDEHLSAQDGSIRYEKKDVTVDLRASIVPTVEGEKVVLRVLAAYIQGFSLDDIGLTKGNQELLRQAADRPFGMILVVGPTGSIMVWEI